MFNFLTGLLKKSLLLILLILIISCSDKIKSDEELLEIDKKKLQVNLDSYKVSTYKFTKILIRASASGDITSPEFQVFKSDLDGIFNKITEPDTDTPENLTIKNYISIYRDYKKMEAFIMRTDEDIFPTLTDAFNVAYGDSTNKTEEHLKGENKEIIQNIEHSILSAITILSTDLGKEVSLYECSKIKPELLPDSEIKTLLIFFRGFIFFEKGFYYLSEDEISRNIDWLDQNKDIDLFYTRLFFKWENLDNDRTHAGFHSLNHLFRGFDRLMMNRQIDEERALKDFEVFLQDAEKSGVDNEIIWSIETYLYLKNKKDGQAITSLTKLKSSHLLSLTDKERIDESIEYIKSRKSGKVLNGFYDNYFLSKISVKYMLSVMSQIDWKKVMKERNVPHTEEMFKTIEKFSKIIENLNEYMNGEKVKEAGKEIQEKSKNFLNTIF